MKKKLLLLTGGFLLLVCAGVSLFVVLALAGFQRSDPKLEKAKRDIAEIEAAATAFKNLYHRWPSMVYELTEPTERVWLKEDLRADPWGQEYHIDPMHLHPTTAVPKIWSDGSEPGRSRKIANWQ